MNSAAAILSPVRIAAWLGGAATLLYSNLFLFPYTPILQSDDQVYFWMYGQRMLHGERPYLDFFQFTPPGTDVFFLVLFKLFGERIWVLNAAVILLGVSLFWMCLQIARRILAPNVAVLCAFAYLVFIFARPLNATHHWFSVLAGMAAVLVLLHESTMLRIASAGALVGLASFFTHPHGVAALFAIAIFLVWESGREEQLGKKTLLNVLTLVISFAAALFVLNVYFVATSGLSQMWVQEITHVGKYRVDGWSIPNFGLPGPLAWSNLLTVGPPLFIYVLLPATYLIVFIRAKFRSTPVTDCKSPILLALVGTAWFIEVALSPNWLRIYAVSMPGIVLAFWFVGRATRFRRYLWPAIALATLVFASFELRSRHHHPYVVADLPAGRAAIAAPLYEQTDWIAKHTHPGDYFFLAGWPSLYVPLGLRNPIFLDTVGTNDQTPPDDVALTIRQLEQKQVRYILWSSRLNIPDPTKPSSYHLDPLRQYLSDHYSLEMLFDSTDELWTRKSPETP
jgi:hypothetical protein